MSRPTRSDGLLLGAEAPVQARANFRVSPNESISFPSSSLDTSRKNRPTRNAGSGRTSRFVLGTHPRGGGYQKLPETKMIAREVIDERNRRTTKKTINRREGSRWVGHYSGTINRKMEHADITVVPLMFGGRVHGRWVGERRTLLWRMPLPRRHI